MEVFSAPKVGVTRSRCRAGLLTVLLCSVFGCVTTPDMKAIHRVKKVAVIGFAATAKADDQSLKYILHTRQTAESLYKLVAFRLQQKQQWTVLPSTEVRKNDVYKPLYKQFTSHLMIAGVRVNGLLAAIESFNLSYKNRSDLFKSLAVDGLIDIGFIVEKNALPSRAGPDQATVSAKISFDLYVKGTHDSVWHVASLPTRIQQPLPMVPGATFRTPEERALAIAINSAMTAMFDQQEGRVTTAQPATRAPAPAAGPTPTPATGPRARGPATAAPATRTIGPAANPPANPAAGPAADPVASPAANPTANPATNPTAAPAPAPRSREPKRATP